MAIQKAAIIGRGALGLLYGDLIARSLGPDAVEYVMDDARFERHQGEALTIDGAPCRVKTIPSQDATPVDLVILATKATGLAGALDVAEGLVGPRTRIVSLLNGIMSEGRAAARFGWKNTVISVAQGMDATFIEGELTYAHPGEIRFGAASETAPETVSDVADFYARAGIAYVVESDIRHRLWTKFVLNVGINQTCMVYGGTYGSASQPSSEQNRSFIAAMREARAVANAEGIDVTEEDLTSMAGLVSSMRPTGMPSMAQDRINKRRTEVEEFAGTILRLAREHDLRVPQNEFLYQRIRQIEKGYED